MWLTHKAHKSFSLLSVMRSAAVIAALLAAPALADTLSFTAWKAAFGKTYATADEYVHRFLFGAHTVGYVEVCPILLLNWLRLFLSPVCILFFRMLPWMAWRTVLSAPHEVPPRLSRS